MMRFFSMLAIPAALGCVWLGVNLAEAEPASISSERMEEIRAEAERGDAVSQDILCFSYTSGIGVPQDAAQAAPWCHKAAELGSVGAQFTLGLMYQLGIGGLAQDYAQAASWYRKAAEQGRRDAQLNLGMMYLSGIGVPQDYAQAAAWYRKAAEQGDAGAQYNVGLAYKKGQGVPQDYAQSVAWFTKAAEQGNAGSQFNLSTMYFKGQGVPQDYAKSYMWANLAAAQGAEIAIQVRDGLGKVMTPSQLEEGQRLTREWLAAHPQAQAAQ